MSLFDLSIFQNFVVALITILNPWPNLSDETKSTIINKTINASIQILRSYEIETTFDKIEINPMTDSVSINNLSFTYYIRSENEVCSLENMGSSKYLNYEDYYGCPVHINLQNFELGGLFSKNQNSFSSKTKFKNLSLDTKIFDNSVQAKAFKKLLDINDNISINFEYISDYMFNKNQLSQNMSFEIVDNAKININTTVSRFNLPFSFEDEDAFNKIKLTINKFEIEITDEGLIEKINLISELNNQPKINDMFLFLIDSTENQLNLSEKGSKNYILSNIHKFLSNSGTINCKNKNIIAFEGYDFDYVFNLEDENSPIWRLCGNIQTR